MDFVDRLSEAKKDGKAVALCIVIETKGAVPRHAGSKMLVYSSGRTEGSVGGGELELRTVEAALESLKDGRSRIVEHSLSAKDPSSVGVCGGEVKVYIEPQVTPTPSGGGSSEMTAHEGEYFTNAEINNRLAKEEKDI